MAMCSVVNNAMDPETRKIKVAGQYLLPITSALFNLSNLSSITDSIEHPLPDGMIWVQIEILGNNFRAKIFFFLIQKAVQVLLGHTESYHNIKYS